MSGPRKRVAIYCRLSVMREGSVSIERQVEGAQKYADSQGWEVVGEPFIDDGVSATFNKPENRQAWRDLLDAPERYDAVLVWKIDRLSRKVLDFLHANEALQAKGAGIVSVTEPIDMTTGQGRAFATMLAVFAEMEAEAIRARVTGARDHLVRSGRVVGGTVPYGWRSVRNPTGDGFVLAHDPGRIDYVRGMAERALRGDSIYSIVGWLDSEGAPLPTASQKRRKYQGRWAYSTVERLLRNPVLAGMTPRQPGRARHDKRDPTAVLRGSNGLPVVDHSVAIVTTEQRRRLLELLDNRDTPQSRPRSSKGITSALLSGLAVCAACSRTMHRGTTQGRPNLHCPQCHQVISRKQLDSHIASRLLEERGDLPIWEHVGTTPGNTVELGDVEQALDDAATRLIREEEDDPVLMEEIAGLKKDRARLRRMNSTSDTIWRITSRTVRQAWEDAQDDEQRREVLIGQVSRMSIVKGRVGRNLDPNRVTIDWRPVPQGIPLPDGTLLVREQEVEVTPGMEGRIGPITVTLPDGAMLYAAKNSTT